MENAVQRYDMTQEAMTPATVVNQVQLIQHVMEKVMKDGEHYGVIPGCGKKPSLLKAGAEKLSLTFRLAPAYEVNEKEMLNGHREYYVKCTLTHIPTDKVFGQGVGACSTMEGKYRFRKGELLCPDCGKATIIKGKKEFGGGWICYGKKGGCGKKWTDADNPFEGIDTDRVEHDNPADYYNTVLKMAKKRAHVDAVLTATAASDIFTQDVEDMPEVINVTPKVAQHTEPDVPDFVPTTSPDRYPEEPPVEPPVAMITEAQRKRFYAMAKGAGREDADIKQFLIDMIGSESTKDIPKSKYEYLCTEVAKKAEAA